MSDAPFSRVVGVLEQQGAGRLADYLAGQRWFASKGRRIADVRLTDAAPLSGATGPAILAIFYVTFTEGPGESYFLPLMVHASQTKAGTESHATMRLSEDAETDLVSDATYDNAACLALVQGIGQGRTWEGRGGAFTCHVTPAGRDAVIDLPRQAKRISAEQSNTSIVFDRRMILKMIRKPEPGTNPDREILDFLTTRTRYRHVPPLLGSIEYARHADPSQRSTVAILQTFLDNQGDGWAYTIAHLRSLLSAETPGASEAGEAQALARVRRFSAEYHRSIRRLGEITGDLHVALQSDPSDPAFRPEAMGTSDIQALKAGMVAQLDSIMAQCRTLPEAIYTAIALTRQELGALLENARLRIERFSETDAERVVKIRVHGDYHLGQVLKTPEGFAILDFEGEPARPLQDRRAKQSALKDVAGMMRSFSYAAQMATRESGGNAPGAHALARAWEESTAAAFWEGYRSIARLLETNTLPDSPERCDRLLRFFALDKAVYELRYELNNRPDWLAVPINGIRRILETG
jgi:maltose alpha-D-glucosyltransferase/alpha-amylase